MGVLLSKVLSVVGRVLSRDMQDVSAAGATNQRAFFRLFVNWLFDLNAPDPSLDSINFQVLTAFSNTFHTLQPSRLPSFAFAWMELISHRMFMPKLLLAKNQKGWP